MTFLSNVDDEYRANIRIAWLNAYKEFLNELYTRPSTVFCMVNHPLSLTSNFIIDLKYL